MTDRCDNYGWLVTMAELVIVPPGPCAVRVKVCGPGQPYGIWMEPLVPMSFLYTPEPSTDTSTRVAFAVDQSMVTIGFDAGTDVLALGFDTLHVTGFGATLNFVKRGLFGCVVGTTTGTVVGGAAVVGGVVVVGALEEDDDVEEDEDDDEDEELEVVTAAEPEPELLLRTSANTNPPSASPARNTPSRIKISLRCRALSAIGRTTAASDSAGVRCVRGRGGGEHLRGRPGNRGRLDRRFVAGIFAEECSRDQYPCADAIPPRAPAVPG